MTGSRPRAGLDRLLGAWGDRMPPAARGPYSAGRCLLKCCAVEYAQQAHALSCSEQQRARCLGPLQRAGGLAWQAAQPGGLRGTDAAMTRTDGLGRSKGLVRRAHSCCFRSFLFALSISVRRLLISFSSGCVFEACACLQRRRPACGRQYFIPRFCQLAHAGCHVLRVRAR